MLKFIQSISLSGVSATAARTGSLTTSETHTPQGIIAHACFAARKKEIPLLSCARKDMQKDNHRLHVGIVSLRIGLTYLLRTEHDMKAEERGRQMRIAVRVLVTSEIEGIRRALIFHF